MNAEPSDGFRGFLRSKFGRILVILIAVGVVFGSYALLPGGSILAIPIFLVIGLAFPIYVGLKRPRYLAVLGLIVLVVVAPLATVVFSQELLAPPPTASTPGVGPFEVGGSVLQNASVSPFTGTPSTDFTWNVTLYPKYLNTSFAGENWSNASVQLFISSCPGATSSNESYCGGAYTLLTVLYAFPSSSAPANGKVITFQDHMPGNGIWSWQMELVLQNKSSAASPYRFELVGDATYDGLEGPIVGGFGVVYAAVIGTIYEIELVYLGIPFYFVLLLYMWFKGREARRKDAIRRSALARAVPGGDSPKPGGAGSGGAPGTAPVAGTNPSELSCPSCGAVVYPKETKCWKCGGTLGASSPGTPLAQGPN